MSAFLFCNLIQKCIFGKVDNTNFNHYFVKFGRLFSFVNIKKKSKSFVEYVFNKYFNMYFGILFI